MRSYCQSCGRLRLEGEWGCPCGGTVYGHSVGPWATATIDKLELQGPLSALVVGHQALVLLKGPKGGGKSSVALQAFARPLVLTTEMSAELLVSYGRRLGSAPTVVDPHLLTDEDGQERWGWEVPGDAGELDGVILDSMNVGASPLPLVQAAVRQAAQIGVPLIIVGQLTQGGDVRGGESVPHLVDVVGDVREEAGQRRVKIEKNRFGPEPIIPFGFGESTTAALFYSVDGPPYKLRPYPWGPSQVWAAVEAGKLEGAPAPPVAAAAVHSDLYGGWVEPPDCDKRAAFAESLGVPYWRPGA